jgi:hypothetical protein
VEHRHVLVNYNLEPLGHGAADHRSKLLPIEIEARHEAREAGADEQLCGEFVGDVETEVADEAGARQMFAEVADRGEIADEDDVGEGAGDERLKAFLAGLQNAERREADRDAGGLGAGSL